MDIDELTHLRDLWRRELMLRVRLIDSKQEKAIGLLGQILILLATINRTQASPMSSSPPTDSPPPQTLWRSLIEPVLHKISREALTSIALWIGGRIAGSYLVPGLLFMSGLIWAWLRSIGG